MKSKLFFFCLFMMSAFMCYAQDIAVQSPSNTTTIYNDLNKAIINAPAGSTVYLPSGIMPISDTVKIQKKLIIIGIGHQPDTEGGNTTIGGNIQFYAGADGSCLMGCYVTGNVNLANADGNFDNFLMRYCNINSLQVGNDKCFGIIINQNYIRNNSNGGSSPLQFTNNVIHTISGVTGGLISNNIIRHNPGWVRPNGDWRYYSFPLLYVNSTLITNNVLIESYSIHNGSNCIISNNMISSDRPLQDSWIPSAWGDNTVIVTDWNEIFAKYDLGVNPLCDYHLKGPFGKNAGTDGTDIGIYGGTGFSDTGLPPYPQIIIKNVPAQTDENGNLKIQVKIKSY